MIRFAVSVLAKYTEHPLLSGLFIISAAFLTVGVISEMVLGDVNLAGFMGVYAVMAAFMGCLGYALIALSKVLFKLQRQFDLA